MAVEAVRIIIAAIARYAAFAMCFRVFFMVFSFAVFKSFVFGSLFGKVHALDSARGVPWGYFRK
jgi:hypothetical protein